MANTPNLSSEGREFLKKLSLKSKEAQSANDHKPGDKVVHKHLGMGIVAKQHPDEKHPEYGARYTVRYPEHSIKLYHNDLTAHEMPEAPQRSLPIKFNAKVQQPSAPPHPLFDAVERMRPHAGKAVAAQQATADRQHTERVAAIESGGKAMGEDAKAGAQAAIKGEKDKKQGGGDVKKSLFAKAEDDTAAKSHPHSYDWSDDDYGSEGDGEGDEDEDDGIDDEAEGGKPDAEQSDEEDASDGDGEAVDGDDQSEDGDDEGSDEGESPAPPEEAASIEPSAVGTNTPKRHQPLTKAEEPKLKSRAHPHNEAHGPKGADAPKQGVQEAPAPAENEQAGGVSYQTFEKVMRHFGKVHGAGKPVDHKFYKGLEEHEPKVDKDIAKKGYNVHVAGGKTGEKPDLKNKNYNTGHLMIYDPSSGSGGDFKDEAYTRTWRKVHEQAHAETYKKINDLYGEGRRMGKLGVHRSPREMKRAVHWEWLAVHRQRELMSSHGHEISDHDFHRELNTVMGDAVHRSITGKFTEPSDFGFEPHSHKVPLEHALKTIDEHSKKLRLRHDNDTFALQAQEKANSMAQQPGGAPPQKEIAKSWTVQEYYLEKLGSRFKDLMHKAKIPFSWREKWDGGQHVYTFKVGLVDVIHKSHGGNIHVEVRKNEGATDRDWFLGKVLKGEIQRFYYISLPMLQKSLAKKNAEGVALSKKHEEAREFLKTLMGRKAKTLKVALGRKKKTRGKWARGRRGARALATHMRDYLARDQHQHLGGELHTDEGKKV